jgi:hypothetical protein
MRPVVAAPAVAPRGVRPPVRGRRGCGAWPTGASRSSGHLARGNTGAQRLEERVEPEVVEVVRVDASGLEVDDHLPALGSDRSADDKVNLAGERQRSVRWPSERRFDDGCPTPIERRERLEELHHRVGARTAQVGEVGLPESSEPRSDTAARFDESCDCLVDNVGWRQLAAPVREEFDRAVADRAHRVPGVPFEGCRVEVMIFTAEHRGEAGLVDEQVAARCLDSD